MVTINHRTPSLLHRDLSHFGRVDAPNGFSIIAYKIQPSKDFDPGENPFHITLHGTTGDEIQPLWTRSPNRRPAPYPARASALRRLYRMLTDRYGIWIVGADTAPQRS